MSERSPLAESAEEALRPLAHARNLAWWDSQVDASEENERRRAATDLTYSDALADLELFASVDAAPRSDGTVAGRQLDLLRNLMLRHQVPDVLRTGIVEL